MVEPIESRYLEKILSPLLKLLCVELVHVGFKMICILVNIPANARGVQLIFLEVAGLKQIQLFPHLF